jgi:hypothetical protein
MVAGSLMGPKVKAELITLFNLSRSPIGIIFAEKSQFVAYIVPGYAKYPETA